MGVCCCRAVWVLSWRLWTSPACVHYVPKWILEGSVEQCRKNKCYNTTNVFSLWRDSPSRRTMRWKETTGNSPHPPLKASTTLPRASASHVLCIRNGGDFSGQPVPVSDHPSSKRFLLNGHLNGVPCIPVGAHCSWRGRGRCIGGF